MQIYFAVLTILLMIGMVLTRVLMMRRNGVEAFKFGKTDRNDFILPPFALLYIYLVVARAYSLPTLSRHQFFTSEVIAWVGVFCCLVGLMMLLLSLISFGKSFRVGIDTENPDELITSGVFAISRNPIYVGFAFILLGQFIIFPNWILLLFVLAGCWLFNRQVLREEAFLKSHYGKMYLDYCHRVRRYL